MRIRHPGSILALAILVLLAIGAALLAREQHRKAALQDAFRLLAAGTELLNHADTTNAQRRFQESIDRFRAVGHDPVLALHHAFAARRLAQPSDRQGVRELFVPRLRDGESLLAMALSDDSTFLAIATQRRLLCLRLENEHWAEWALPQPIERAATLHVERTSGTAHLVSGDDGRLMSADCRASDFPLLITPSASEGRPAVAWLDAKARRVWIAPARPAGAEIVISAQPLPAARGEPIRLQVAFPGEANTLFAESAVVHSIAKVEDNLLVFYGDANLLEEHDLRDESVLVVAIDEPERAANRLVFPASARADGGTTRWRSTHARRVLPASAPGRVYVLTEGPRAVTVLDAKAKPLEIHAGGLFATAHRDGREIYDFGVTSTGNGALVEVKRRRSGVGLSYRLPWGFDKEPELAAISREGRCVAVATEAGEILLVDVSSSTTPRY